MDSKPFQFIDSNLTASENPLMGLNSIALVMTTDLLYLFFFQTYFSANQVLSSDDLKF